MSAAGATDREGKRDSNGCGTSALSRTLTMAKVPWQIGSSVSRLTGIGISNIIRAIIDRVPPPTAQRDQKLKALLFYSSYDRYRGVISLFSLQDGQIKKGKSFNKLTLAAVPDRKCPGVRRCQGGEARPSHTRLRQVPSLTTFTRTQSNGSMASKEISTCKIFTATTGTSAKPPGTSAAKTNMPPLERQLLDSDMMEDVSDALEEGRGPRKSPALRKQLKAGEEVEADWKNRNTNSYDKPLETNGTRRINAIGDITDALDQNPQIRSKSQTKLEDNRELALAYSTNVEQPRR
ncbi:hypothetical protein M407DRAFT_218128 [Tulasnella calospora MUT 4182]|uniref:Uncharacterized protein n=1 Tax=Tulasnella calospora MUT 4182 TaxID=1051891 RepID=A0A0C3Q9Y1_9AGAM|nr:hypothetical protein M407DRAFT_218128 [Tulasnella calospora MUT 4182]